MDLMDCAMVLCWLSGFLAGALCFVVVSQALHERGRGKRTETIRESTAPENMVFESERANLTVSGWRIARRRRSDVAWLIVDWSARVLAEEPLYAGSIGMCAFQDGVELERPLCSDDAPERIRISNELRILPGTTVELRDVFVMRSAAPVMVSFDDGETLIPLEDQNKKPDRDDQATKDR